MEERDQNKGEGGKGLRLIQPSGRKRAFIVLVLLVADIVDNREKKEARFGFSNVAKAFYYRDRITH